MENDGPLGCDAKVVDGCSLHRQTLNEGGLVSGSVCVLCWRKVWGGLVGCAR